MWRSHWTRPSLTVLFLLALVEIYSIFPPRPKASTIQSPFHFLQGAIHVHSTYSFDGGGGVEEIVQAAERTGLDFVVLTDHLNTQARIDGKEKKYGPVDLFVEMEASVRVGHILTFYTHTALANTPYLQFNELARLHVFQNRRFKEDVFQIIAHPTNLKKPWDRLDLIVEGLEVVNFNSSWQRQAKDSPLRFLGTLLLAPFNPYAATLRFFEPYPRDFAIWDEWNQKSPGRSGILAHDAHSRIGLTQTLYARWPKYETLFSMASNIVLLKAPPHQDFQKRKRQVYKAIRKGRLAIVYQLIHPFKGNDWHIQCGSNRYRSGDQGTFIQDDCQLHVQVPHTFPYPVEMKLLRNGKHVQSFSKGHRWQTSLNVSGVYRLEVWAKTRSLLGLVKGQDTPYVFYNPIYLN